MEKVIQAGTRRVPEKFIDSDVSEVKEDTLHLASDIGNSAGSQLQESLQEAVQNLKPVRINASQVTQIGTVAVQLMISASKSAKDQGSHLRLVGASEKFIAAFDDLGLQNHISKWTSKS